MIRSICGALIVATMSCGCGSSGDGEHHCNDGSSDNALSGSYCEDLDLAFKEVKCLAVGSALRIEYVRPIGTTNEKALQIIIDGSIVVLEPNVEIKLLEAGAQVRRITVNAPQPIPLTEELEPRSSITFSQYGGAIGSRASGKFNLLFKSGRTLSGDFDCTIEDARPPGT